MKVRWRPRGTFGGQPFCQEDVLSISIFHRSAHPLHEFQRGRSIKRMDGTLPSTLCRAMIDHRKHGLVVLLVNRPVAVNLATAPSQGRHRHPHFP
jgi:hypothetical protein